MKGVVFNIVEEVVVNLYDEDTWDDVIDAAGVHGTYSSPGSYPDEDLYAIVGAAAELLGVEVPALLRIVGQKAFDGLARRYPDLVGAQTSTIKFLSHVEDYIHPEVKKLYPEAILPKFEFSDLPTGETRMLYSSPRGLHHLAEGLIEGAAERFGETIRVGRPDLDLGPDTTAFDLSIVSS